VKGGGSHSHQNHFKAPFIFIENGKPTRLFAATEPGSDTWQFGRIWNMVISLKADN
jgi:hypothetical protein